MRILSIAALGLLMAWPPLPLAAEPAPLPLTLSDQHPAIRLELGRDPAPGDPRLPVQMGTLTATQGVNSVANEPDELQLLHPGFGEFGGSFDFPLPAKLIPGQYRIYARYKSGGEVAQAIQNFTVRAGADTQSLGVRGSFTLSNPTPWQYQWLQAPGTLAIFAGDRTLRIEDSGRADGAKVFDAFLMQLETPLTGVSEAGGQARNRFLQQIKTPASPQRHLYVLDGTGNGGDTLFDGLGSEASRAAFENLAVHYLQGAEADGMADRLNLKARPAAIVADDRYTLLGTLSTPKSTAQVTGFLRDPEKNGTIPAVQAPALSPPDKLRNGFPASWLVGGLQDGKAGISIYGLDTESILRPNPGQPYYSTRLMGGGMKAWRPASVAPAGLVTVEATLDHDYQWAGGSAYAHVYLFTSQLRDVLLRSRQSGDKTSIWLDGVQLEAAVDPDPPAAIAALSAFSRNAEPARRTVLTLNRGWHRLLVKLNMRHGKGEPFMFAAQFADAQGNPLEDLRTQLNDPDGDTGLNPIAGQLRPLIDTNAPANLPRPGEPLRLKVDMRWHPFGDEKALATPLPRFDGLLDLRVVDYSGREIVRRNVPGRFPGLAPVDLGKAPGTGYYAVYATLKTRDGKVIAAYPADGFSVVGGNAAQRNRLDRKKLWNNNYYALADGDRGFRQPGAYFQWLERMGIFRSYGGYPGFEPPYQGQWAAAKKRGIELFADSSGDSHWLNDKPGDTDKFVQSVAPYTRFLKASNEIDIRQESEWQALREPAHWVERAQREYQAWHRVRPDAHYVGGSLVRPGDMDGNGGFPGDLGPGRWFEQVLKLGLDRYQDAWDVHAYPRDPPRFGGPIGNGATEDERGVLRAYAAVGKTNALPFWLGEVGAKAVYGDNGRRWQAEQAAKMLAWANSRGDYLGIAYCVAHEYDGGFGRLFDYAMGHKPGEAALYTAGALIDGLPYQALNTGDNAVQAAYFGETFMIWRTDDRVTDWPLPLDRSKRWLFVDVVGQARELAPEADGKARLKISQSPLYVLTTADYERLTGLKPL